jgi:hypothetical protein
VRYGLIESMRRGYPVALMCRVLNVCESGFHARRVRPPCERERENKRLEVEILATIASTIYAAILCKIWSRLKQMDSIFDSTHQPPF